MKNEVRKSLAAPRALLSTLVLSTALLSACGGGGAGTDTAQSAEGFWKDGTGATGVLVTSGGEVWGIDTTDGDVSAMVGSAAVNGHDVSGNVTLYWAGYAVAATVGGTVSTQSKLNVSLTAAGVSSTAKLSYDSRYDTAASLSTLAGSWSMDGAGTVTVSSAGALTGSISGCTFSGTVAPDSGGKGYFRAALTFGAAPCALPGQTASGVIAQLDSASAVTVLKANASSVAFASTLARN